MKPELERLGLLTLVDRAAFTALCLAWARLHAAEKALADHGMVLDDGRLNPAIRVSARATDQIVRLSHEFGLTPASRAGLAVAVPKGEGEAEQPDDIEAFLRRRRQRVAADKAS